MTVRKPMQIVCRFDGAVIALAASGELFGQSRGEWEPMAGIEGERIVGIAVRPQGALVVVTASGGIYEQFRTGVTMGDYSQSWRPVPSLPT